MAHNSSARPIDNCKVLVYYVLAGQEFTPVVKGSGVLFRLTPSHYQFVEGIRRYNNAMARIPTENVAEVTMTFLQDGQYLINKHAFLNTAGWDEGSLNNLGTAVREWWDTNLKAKVTNQVQLVAIECVDLTAGSGLGTAVTTGLPITGTSAQPAPPNNVTLSIKKATGLIGRSFRGRTYHVGLPENVVTNNTVDTAFVGQLRDAYDALKQPLGALIPVDLCVLSEWADGAPRTEGICTVVTGIGVDPIVDSQRRRLPGRGR